MPGRGVTLADMTMRNWLTQPGYILIQLTILDLSIRDLKFLLEMWDSLTDRDGRLDIQSYQLYPMSLILPYFLD